jgi:hypothetical protein
LTGRADRLVTDCPHQPAGSQIATQEETIMTDTTTAREAADQASEAIRSLNYLTLPADGAPGLEFPSDAYDIIGGVKTAAQRMPQLFSQLTEWLVSQYEANRVGHDSGEDAVCSLADVNDALAEAAAAAGKLEDALNRAHNASSGLTGLHQN